MRLASQQKAGLCLCPLLPADAIPSGCREYPRSHTGVEGPYVQVHILVCRLYLGQQIRQASQPKFLRTGRSFLRDYLRRLRAAERSGALLGASAPSDRLRPEAAITTTRDI
jgi:hypothetical protein